MIQTTIRVPEKMYRRIKSVERAGKRKRFDNERIYFSSIGKGS